MFFEFSKSYLLTESDYYQSKDVMKVVNKAKMTAIKHGLYDQTVMHFRRVPYLDSHTGRTIRIIKFYGVEIEGLGDPVSTEEYKRVEDEAVDSFIYTQKLRHEPISRYIKESNRRKREQEKQEQKEKKKEPLKEKTTVERIAEYVNKPGAYARFDNEVRSRILGQPNIPQITYNVFTWLRGISQGVQIKNNALLVAPSGCGKTETYRVIKDILDREIGGVPVIQLDATKLTPEGYRGLNTDEFLEPLLVHSDNGIGIVVLDELDKKLLPSTTSRGENVNHDIQSQLLTIIEGIKLNSKGKNIDTRNTLFIGAGAFQHIRDCLEREKKTTIGFKDDALMEEERKVEVNVAEIIKHGAMNEFMGRFTSVINLYKLDKKSVKIIVGRYTEEFEQQLSCEIVFDKSAIDELYDIYLNSELGCRILKSTMWTMISPVAIELERKSYLGRKRKCTIIVSKDGATYERQPAETRQEFSVAG